MIKQIDHIGIAVSMLDQQVPFYRDILRLEFIGIEEVPEQKVKTALFQIGEVRIELLEPTSPESPIAKFIEKRGEGLHHIAYRSDGIVDEIAFFKGMNVSMIDELPRDGVNGSKIAFLHPKSSGKVLTEICQIAGEVNE
ncbi:MAG: methylmalonyl-CoA epimerase [Candidatus Marinimicrobia bacterium CG08_land_8_20_14_0_20_45_22]|nr:MAG: methylmalonyl-CoA epimerase [Candidatus Marinimicrobia bacterium CG08_land_8_20_14_0_20_45_22]